MDEKDVELIVKDIVTPIVLKAMEEIDNANESVDDTIVEIITELANRLNSCRIEVAKNVSFIKSVLIHNGLTTQTEYDKYMQEWDRLNGSIVCNSPTKSVSEDSLTVNTIFADNN